jgi:hypothetical protein
VQMHPVVVVVVQAMERVIGVDPIAAEREAA